MIDWRLSIRPASFRGVSFGVFSGELEAGRRVVLHEFPQRDMPFAEDMGAAPHKFTLEAFVVGPDYLSRRDKLEKALQEPGSGTLVHPWHGEIEVAQFAPYKVKHTAQDGGMCVFSLSFVRVAAPEAPAASVNPAFRALLAAAEAVNLAAQALDSAISLVNETAYVISSTKALFNRAISIVEAFVGGNFANIGNLIGNLPGGDSLGSSLAAEFSLLGGNSSKEADALAWAKAASADYSVPDPLHAGSARQTIRKNGLALVAFIRQASLVEACKIASGVDPASRASAASLKDALVDAFDAAMSLRLPVYPAETVAETEAEDASLAAPENPELARRLSASLLETRNYALAAIAAAAKSAPEIVEITPAQVSPCLVLAYRYGGNSSLAGDLAARNSIVHPGFAPIQSLEAARG